MVTDLTGADDDTDSGAGSNGALGEFASETLGQGLSERGGFGIADRIIQELSHTGNQHGNGQVTQESAPKGPYENFSMTRVIRSF